jgi:hypothetical protein
LTTHAFDFQINKLCIVAHPSDIPKLLGTDGTITGLLTVIPTCLLQRGPVHVHAMRQYLPGCKKVKGL